MNHAALLVALCGWLALGVVATPSSAQNAAQNSADTQVRLHIDESATAPNSKTVITLTDVTKDQRCPTDVDCVWSGDATVMLRVQPARGAAQVVELHTGLSDKRAATAAGLRLRVERLEPGRTTTKPTVERGAYVATIAIAKAP